MSDKSSAHLIAVAPRRFVRRVVVAAVGALIVVTLVLAVYLLGSRLGLFPLGEEARYFCKGSVYALRFVSDEQSFVSAVVDPSGIWLWNASTEEHEQFPDYGRAIDVSRDGKWMVCGNYQGEVTLLQLPTGKVTRQWKLPKGSALGVAISGDGAFIYIAQGPKWTGHTTLPEALEAYHFWVFRSADQDIGSPDAEFNTPVRAIDASHDGSIIGLRTSSHSLWAWSEHQNGFIYESSDRRAYGGSQLEWRLIGGVKVSSDGVYILCGYRLLNTHTGVILDLSEIDRPIGLELKSCDLSDDGRRAAFGYDNGIVQVVDIPTQSTVFDQRVSLSGGTVLAVAFSPDGNRLLTGGSVGRGAFTPLSPKQGVVKRTDPYIRLWKLTDLPK